MQICPSGFFRRDGSQNEESLDEQPEARKSFVNSVNASNMSNFKMNKKRNSRKRKGHVMHQTKTLSFLSCNASSIKNKLFSLEKIINDQTISFFALQETHAKRNGSIRFKNSQNYHIYEHIRSNKSVGGLATGIL